jgi:tetratricopeptide (TPR) repeat protein
MVSRRLAAIGFAAFTLLSTTPAFAQSLADKETARALMDEGDQKRDAKDYKAALAAYEKADAIMHVPTTGLEVARMQAQLGLLLEARETLGRVVRIPPKDKEPQAFVNARKAADQLNDELGRRIPAVQLVITGVDAGQVPEVTIDNEPLPPAVLNVPRKVNPGTHNIVVKAGGNEKKIEVSVVEKETKTVNVDLKEKPAESGKTVKVDTSNVDESSTPKILMFGGFGLAVVGIGVGSVTGLMSMSKVDEIKENCNAENKCRSDQAGAIDDAKMLGNISTLAFAAGGLGAAIGIVGLVMMSGSKESSTPPGTTAKAATLVKTQPVVGAGYLGLSGTF